MKLHIFQSTKQPDVFGFTPDETGANLPVDLSPWTSSGEDALAGGAAVGSSKPVVTGVERDGFYVARSETLARNTGVPWVGK